MLSLRISLVVLLALVTWLSTLQSSADQDYAGEFSGKGARIVLSSVVVQLGIQAYYKIHGDWPDSWQAVQVEGLWQTGIPSKTTAVIDPDDDSIEFYDDVYFAAANSGINASVIMGGQGPGAPPLRTITVEPPKTYSFFFEEMDPYLDSTLAADYAQDTAMLRLFAILGEFSNMVSFYATLHGEYPSNLQEFLDSGLSPVDLNSINPVTGTAFRFDGSAGDVLVSFDDGYFDITHIERNGETPVTGFTY